MQHPRSSSSLTDQSSGSFDSTHRNISLEVPDTATVSEEQLTTGTDHRVLADPGPSTAPVSLRRSSSSKVAPVWLKDFYQPQKTVSMLINLRRL